MTGRVPPDRWTCPTCGETVAPDTGDDTALAAVLRYVQVRHARAHRVPALQRRRAR